MFTMSVFALGYAFGIQIAAMLKSKLFTMSVFALGYAFGIQIAAMLKSKLVLENIIECTYVDNTRTVENYLESDRNGHITSLVMIGISVILMFSIYFMLDKKRLI